MAEGTVYSDSYTCDHPGCYSAVELQSGFKKQVTTYKLRMVMISLGWLVFWNRAKELVTYCPGCRKAHELEAHLEIRRRNHKPGRKAGK